MSTSEMKAFVTKADGSFVRVKLLDDSFKPELINLGFSYDRDLLEYVIQTNENSIKAAVFKNLRDLDVNFSGGKEWCPSEIFEYLRETGLVNGQFRKVSWTGPGDYHVSME